MAIPSCPAWRFDFCWPDRMVAVECEGGIWGGGPGFEADCEKYNAAIALGWRVLRVTRGILDRDPLGFFDILIELLTQKGGIYDG